MTSYSFSSEQRAEGKPKRTTPGLWQRWLQQCHGRWAGLLGLLGTCVFFTAYSESSAGIPEPETIFYGKVIHRNGAYTQLLTEGSFTWVITSADGRQLRLDGNLQPFKNQPFSYRLGLPHEAAALGASVRDGKIPLGPGKARYTHVEVLVNGTPARIVAPGQASFDIAQATRAATFRLDLETSNEMLDSDGNGIPDWWEKQYGQTGAAADPDRDGLNNLAEFRAGTDPNQDNRVPQLATSEILVYADGTTALGLKAIDSDSRPAELIYTLTKAPSNGALYRRNARNNGAEPDVALAANDSFSQADVESGRLVFVHDGGDPPAVASSFEVSLRDEDPAHAPFNSAVTLRVYRPTPGVSEAQLEHLRSGLPRRIQSTDGLSPPEQLAAATYLLSRDFGFVIRDASLEAGAPILVAPSAGLTPLEYQSQYRPAYGSDHKHVLIGSPGADQLRGGMEDDILVGGPGADSLRGGGGADLFILTSANDGDDRIEDFNPGEGDTIDLSQVLTGPSNVLSDYLQVSTVGSDSLLRISPQGSAGGEGLTLTLAGLQLAQTDVEQLVESGRLVVGDKRSPTRVSIAATVANTSENGLKPGEFVVGRTGSIQSELTVNLIISGSAVNGTDYQRLDSQVTFGRGESNRVLTIAPYADTQSEPTEVVEVSIASGSGYEIVGQGRASVTIEDLLPEIAIEAIEPVAVKASRQPGVLLLRRSGMLDRNVFVFLEIKGTADRGTDYASIATRVNLLAGEATAALEIEPLASALLAGGTKYVEVTVKSDSSYRVGAPASARACIIEEKLTLEKWRQRELPEVAGDLDQFAMSDFGQRGLPNITRYAYGLDARDPSRSDTSKALPQIVVLDGHLAIRFRRPAAVTDLQYQVQVSDDLVNWRGGPAQVEQIDPPAADEPETVYYRMVNKLDPGTSRFMRVRASRVP